MTNQVRLKNQTKFFEHDTFMELFLKSKEPDCVLYSKEGVKFNIHKEILYQSKLMKNISIQYYSGYYQDIEIFCPCPANEIESVLNFLYNGPITFNEETETSQIVDNLIKIFGFSEKLFSVKSCPSVDANANMEFEKEFDTSKEDVVEEINASNQDNKKTNSTYNGKNSVMRSKEPSPDSGNSESFEPFSDLYESDIEFVSDKTFDTLNQNNDNLNNSKSDILNSDVSKRKKRLARFSRLKARLNLKSQLNDHKEDVNSSDDDIEDISDEDYALDQNFKTTKPSTNVIQDIVLENAVIDTESVNDSGISESTETLSQSGSNTSENGSLKKSNVKKYEEGRSIRSARLKARLKMRSQIKEDSKLVHETIQSKNFDKILSVHIKEGKFKCIICEFFFKSKPDLQIHFEKFHKNINPKLCGLCNTEFARMKTLREHIISAHLKNEFPKRSQIISQMNSDQPYKCYFCDQRFHLESKLEIHKLQYHPHLCNFCRKRFTSKEHLNKHHSTNHVNNKREVIIL